MTKTQFNIAAAGILGACAAGGDLGAPGGVMYAGLMSKGYTLQDFNSILGAMVTAGLIDGRGDCYTLTAAGIEINSAIDAAIAERNQKRAAA